MVLLLLFERRDVMRSGLVFAAKQFYPNRFELVHQASQFARRLHLTKERMGDTINQALERITAKGEQTFVTFGLSDERTDRCQDELHTLTP